MSTKVSDDLTASQYSLISQAVNATSLAQHDKDLVMANVLELCNPQAKSAMSNTFNYDGE